MVLMIFAGYHHWLPGHLSTGEKIPVDGIVIEGRGEVDQAPITGESVPVIKEAGAEVHGGTLNQLGNLKVRVTQIGEDTTLSKIIYLVQKAQAEKPPIERIADRFAAWFTPVMLTLAAAVWGITGEVLRAVTLLVAACPCAMVIAAPTAVVAGIGNAARKGILIKGGAVLETISQLTTVAFDKTGTLTYGTPTIRSVRGFGDISEDKVFRSGRRGHCSVPKNHFQYQAEFSHLSDYQCGSHVAGRHRRHWPHCRCLYSQYRIGDRGGQLLTVDRLSIQENLTNQRQFYHLKKNPPPNTSLT
jgi:magnesium-transporting ATPase (P-type)